MDHILEQFNEDKILLRFISKNLSWGIFKNELLHSSDSSDFDFHELYTSVFENEASDKLYRNPEVMLYLIIELTGSTCYSSILYEEPVPIQELKPYLFQSIRQIIRGQEITGDAVGNSRVKKA